MELRETLKYYKGRRVLITGHTGFKGSWLSYILDSIGAEILGYSLEPNTEPSLFKSLSFSKKFNSIIGDIRNKEKLKETVQSFKPEFIFHMAAQPLVIESYKNPKETFDINFTGTLNLLEILKDYNQKVQAVFITTDKVYENLELEIPFLETDKLGGKDPYSASKAACELLIHSYRTSFFKDSKINIASVRAGNVIGGGDWSENRLIPDIIRSVFENKTLAIRNLGATRPWQHVLEPLHGYLVLAIGLCENPLTYSGAWNFGPETGDVKTVKEIVEIAQANDLPIKMEVTSTIQKREANYLSLNIEKAKNKLDWTPKWDSEYAIHQTLSWYQKFYEGAIANELIQENLEKYTTI
jgi:CDP-glucose 4,6-dehydratase